MHALMLFVNQKPAMFWYVHVIHFDETALLSVSLRPFIAAQCKQLCF